MPKLVTGGSNISSKDSNIELDKKIGSYATVHHNSQNNAKIASKITIGTTSGESVTTGNDDINEDTTEENNENIADDVVLNAPEDGANDTDTYT